MPISSARVTLVSVLTLVALGQGLAGQSSEQLSQVATTLQMGPQTPRISRFLTGTRIFYYHAREQRPALNCLRWKASARRSVCHPARLQS